MKRKHTLSEKHPLLSMLLSIAAPTLVCALAGSIRASDFVQYLLMSAAGVLCLLAQKWWFAPAFKGVFRAEIPLREIGLLCVPFLIQLVLAWRLNIMDHGLFFRATALSVAMALSAGFSEEVMFRGYLLTTLARKNNIWVAVACSSLFFALFHAGNASFSIIGFVNLALFGFFAAIVTLRRGSIWAISAIHAAWNFAQGNVFGFNVSGTPMTDTLLATKQNNFGAILSGGEFGLEGGLGATIVLLVAILLVLMSPTKKSETVKLEDNDDTDDYDSFEEIRF